MDKNAIKKYAVWARRELIERVSQKAQQYGITADEVVAAGADSVHGHVLSTTEKTRRDRLVQEVRSKGYEQTMEEAAYTWFNRFIALRFMEVNGYLPSHVRVFTDEDNNFKPQILTEAINLDLDGLDMEKVYELKNANKTEELYKYLLLTQCNALGAILPGMFQSIDDYMELLFPDNLLREGSVVERMIIEIDQEDWRDQVQIIGWLYQYYNSEPKDQVFADLKKNIKVSKEKIPAATQLFTPDWIVRYMVENSLGRLWVEGHPNEELKAGWKYYLDEAEQEPEVQAQLDEIRKGYAAMSPEDIKCIDPCMGSGHILVYMFDVLMQIYETQGYSRRDAVSLILQKNLYGLDIDDRAAQLAYFSVMMKARQYDSRFFALGVQPNVYSTASFPEGAEFGSLVTVDEFGEKPGQGDQFGMYDRTDLNTWNVQRLLAQKYDVVVTNPPYMGSSNMNGRLAEFVKENYPNSKSDLFAVFIERCGKMTKPNGYQAMITQQSWMSLPSFLDLRKEICRMNMIVSLIQMGSHSFDEISGEVVSSVAFSFRQHYEQNYVGMYFDLQKGMSEQEKESMYLAGFGMYHTRQDMFALIPNEVMAYDASEAAIVQFGQMAPLKKTVIAKPGMQTSDNDRFLRFWFEICHEKIGYGFTHEMAAESRYKWFPYNKGIGFRKWYGNNDYVVNFYHDGEELKYWLVHNPKDPGTKHWSRNLRNYDYYFSEGITFTAIGSNFSARLNGAGYLFDTKGPTMFGDHITYVCGFVNSIVFDYYNRMLCKQITKSGDSVNLVPFEYGRRSNEIESLVEHSVTISKQDWDSFETSWDFQWHPIVRKADSRGHWGSEGDETIEYVYRYVAQDMEERFQRLKANEEELNRIFIDIYGLQDELTPEVEDKDVTVRRPDLQRDIKSLISYAVGCMFGRYSLDTPGLAYAGGAWDDSKYRRFQPDRDNIIPITDDEYFEDDIVARFIRWVEVVFGKSTLEENLKFIADALGGTGAPRDVIRSYFLNDFYADHLKTYQKRPIYWLFGSGKKGGFKALIYMHRYQPDTIARMRTDYVHEQQSRYRTAIADVERRMKDASTSEQVKLKKRLAKLQAQDAELLGYEEKIHHLADQMIRIDLDDGVKVNYAKFQDVLAPIK